MDFTLTLRPSEGLKSEAGVHLDLKACEVSERKGDIDVRGCRMSVLKIGERTREGGRTAADSNFSAKKVFADTAARAERPIVVRIFKGG